MNFINPAFSDIVNGVLGILIEFNESGKIIYASDDAKEIFDYGDAIVGLSVERIFPALFRNLSQYSELISYLQNNKKEIIAYRRNNTCFPVKLKVAVTKTERPSFLLQIFDLQAQEELSNKLERMELELKEATTRQNEFVANVTHELRTPVNGIKGHVEFLESQGDLTEEQVHTLKIIERCCINMEKIINNLLDFSKLDAGKFEVQEEKFQFRDMMNHVLDTNIKQANQKGITLTMNIAETIPDILYGDSLRIGQILNNLVSNAIKFTSVGYVRIECVDVDYKDNRVELFFLVMDSGIGIAQEDMGKLFHNFSQVDGSITRQYGGTGLGLAISKQLIEKMNGSIKVESVKGQGSTFAFSIVVKTGLEELRSKDEEKKLEQIQINFNKLLKQMPREDVSKKLKWGSEENDKELEDTLGKLVLCIEMKSWEKAEGFSSKIKSLVAEADMELKKQVFRMEMAVRKENYEQSMEAYNGFIEMRNVYDK